MSHTLSGKRVACLIANGFAQGEMVAFQKAMLECEANVRTVSSETGLVNGWDKTMWGHNFAVDVPLNKALSADYDMLVIPGGERSIDKLSLTEHTRRFISGFVNMGKPVVCMNEGVRALITSIDTKGCTFACDCMTEEEMQEHGFMTSKDMVCVDRNIVSCQMNENTMSVCVAAAVECVKDCFDTMEDQERFAA
jgi:protease I